MATRFSHSPKQKGSRRSPTPAARSQPIYRVFCTRSARSAKGKVLARDHCVVGSLPSRADFSGPLKATCQPSHATLRFGAAVVGARGQGAGPQPAGLNTRAVAPGYFSSLAAGRDGRASSSPPQFGHVPARRPLAQSRQNVHSKEQIRASVDSGGKSRSQHSQPGRIWSMAKPRKVGWRRSLPKGPRRAAALVAGYTRNPLVIGE